MSHADIKEYEALVRRLKTLSVAQTVFLKSLLFGKLDQAKSIVSKTLALVNNSQSRDIIELRDALKALQINDIEVDVTSTKLMMAEELTILRNSTHNAKLLFQPAKSATPVVTARGSLSKEDYARMMSLEDENIQLRELLEQSRAEVSQPRPEGVLITSAVASLNQNFANELDVLKSQVSHKNTTIAEQASTIARLEKEVARLNITVKEVTKNVEEAGGGSNGLDAEVLLMKLQHEQANMEWEMMMTEKTLELNKAADERVKLVERRLETEKEEMMDAMAQEVDEIEKAKDKERRTLLDEKMKLEAEVALSGNVTKSIGKNLTAVAVKAQSLGRYQKEMNEMVMRDLNEMRKTLQFTMNNGLLEKLKTLKNDLAVSDMRYRKEMVERKKLHNMVQELKGNIRVYMRCRPPSKKEIEQFGSEALCVSFPQPNEVSAFNSEKNKVKTWEFDEVFDVSSTQDAVYKDVSALVVSVLDGYNVCIFAYGQTGSGKTWTMSGPPSDRGVNTRALGELFERTQARSSMTRDTITVSLLEVYNEDIRDLLVAGGSTEKLEIRQGDQGNYVPGLTVMAVQDLQDVFDLLTLADSNRSQAMTNMNEHSSRSHMMLTITVISESRQNGVITRGKLNLVDLAGSERLNKSGATGQALKEAQNINKSLSALGDVIAARAAKQSHVPFRNSTLTYLLQDCLSQDSKTLMIVCVSPVLFNVEETFCSLNFASRVRTIELGKASKNTLKEGTKRTK